MAMRSGCEAACCSMRWWIGCSINPTIYPIYRHVSLSRQPSIRGCVDSAPSTTDTSALTAMEANDGGGRSLDEGPTEQLFRRRALLCHLPARLSHRESHF